MVLTIYRGSEGCSNGGIQYQPHQLPQKQQCDSMPFNAKNYAISTLLCLTSEKEVSEGIYTTNHQKRSICAIKNGIILKDNSKAHIIPNPL